MSKQAPKSDAEIERDTEPDWKIKCSNCGAVPTLPITGMCGPCTFGEAETAEGDW